MFFIIVFNATLYMSCMYITYDKLHSEKFVFTKSKSRIIVEHTIKLYLVCDQNQCSFYMYLCI